MNRSVIKFGICLSLLAFLAGTAMAAQTVHYFEDFTDGVLNDDLAGVSIYNPGAYTAWGGTFPNFANLALQSQKSWRNASQTYYGPTQATAFDSNTGFGAQAVAFGASLVNTPVLQAGNVWVFDISMISDVAVVSSTAGFFAQGPGPIVEWDFADNDIVRPTGFDESALSALQPSVSQNVLSTSYTAGGGNGIDNQAASEPNAIPTSLTDAGLPAALNNVLRAKYVYQKVGADATRANTQVLAPNGSSLGTLGKNVEGAGFFRDDYSGGGLLVQMNNGHGNGNVTYSAGRTAAGGVGDGVDEVYSNAVTDLELGLTSLTFKQVSRADFDTDGDVDAGGDGFIFLGNFGGSGKSFFEGDATGDGIVDAGGDGFAFLGAFGTDLVAAGTAIAKLNPATGQILISSNNVVGIEIQSAANNLVVANKIPLAGIENANLEDAPTVSKVNWASFLNGPLGTPGAPANDGILNDLSLGAILPIGFSNVGQLTFRYTVLGQGIFTSPVTLVPEPTSLGIAGLGMLGLAGVGLRRRRRAA